MAARSKKILVTGATDGIGRQTAVDLARLGAEVIVHGRDEERCQAVAEQIKREAGRDVADLLVADFSSLDAVRHLAKQVGSRHDGLDVLVNNAGIGAGPLDQKKRARETSEDGFELRFAVNYLAPFLLTLELLPLLERSSPSRIVNVASVGQAAIDFDDVMLQRRYSGLHAYRQSKLALVMFTFELAPRIADRGVAVNALHPGTLLATKMVYESFGQPLDEIQPGADAEVYLATSPELDGVTGKYFDQMQESRAHRQAYDPAARRRLWRLSAELTGASIEEVEAADLAGSFPG